MKIQIANKDRSEDLGGEISAGAETLRKGKTPKFLYHEHSALALRDARSDEEFMERWQKLARMRCGIDAVEFDIPVRKGPLGILSRKLKSFLWRLLRYQHEHTFEQQVLVNEIAVSGLSFQRTSDKRHIAALEARIADLEAQLSSAERAAPPSSGS